MCYKTYNMKKILIPIFILLLSSCATTKKNTIHNKSEKKADSVYHSTKIIERPPILSSLTINDICDSITNKPIQFKKEIIIINDTILIETVNDDLQISVNLASGIISKQDSIIKVRNSEIIELKELHTLKTKVPFKHWLYLLLSIALNIFLIYLLIKSKFSFKNLL